MNNLRERRLRGVPPAWGLAAVLPLVLAAFSSAQLALYLAEVGTPVPWRKVLLWQLPVWYLWAALTPLVVRIARRHPLERDRPWRWLLHLLAALALSLVHLAAHVVLLAVLLDAKWLPALRLNFAASYHWNLIVYGLLVSAVSAWDYHRRYQDRELRATQLEAELARAELDALRLQLQPHFLFNTLQSIAELVHEDPDGAERMVVRLSELLRLSLDAAAASTQPLRDELAFLDRYLEIQRVRFGDRLGVEVSAEAAALDCPVPSLCLQPLVENAVRHGAARRPGGQVVIRARREGDMLEIGIVDDGEGGPGPAPDGIGLANTRARLLRLYGDRQQFEAAPAPQGGFAVRLRIPVPGTCPTGEAA